MPIQELVSSLLGSDVETGLRTCMGMGGWFPSYFFDGVGIEHEDGGVSLILGALVQ